MILSHWILLTILLGCGFYLLMRRSLIRMVLGILVLSHAVNLLLFFASKPKEVGIPFISENASVLATSAPDPLPQALILTAIVISLGVLAFLLGLFKKVFKVFEEDDPENLEVGP